VNISDPRSQDSAAVNLETISPAINPAINLESVSLHRQQFSLLQGKQYFNYGGQGPMADSAIAQLTYAQHKIQTEGPFSNAVYQWLQDQGEQVRQAIAQALGTAASTITLTENVTVGCNIPLWGLPWQKGDHILMGDCEHPGVVAAIAELSRRYGLTVTTCALSSGVLPSGGSNDDGLNDDRLNHDSNDPVAVIERHLQPNTRLVVISHILWNTGQVLPLKEIVDCCHNSALHTRILVDAAQSAGTLPLDHAGWQLPETGVDYYAFTGHKWWCGPAGVGALYVRPEVLEETAPTFVGWRGIEVDSASNPTGWKPDARRYEVATADYPLWSALIESMAVQASWGTSMQRYERICTLSKRLWEGLRAMPQVKCLLSEAPPSGLVSFQLIGDNGHSNPALHNGLVQALEAQKMYVRTLLSPNCVRACVHYFTLETEVDALLEAIETFLT
jgi:L-cysteine/cystine lyase